jgi:hypothetical protein
MKKIDLGAIAAAPSTAASKHPIVTPDGDMAALLEQFGIINPQFTRLENQSKTLSKQLAAPIRGLYYRTFAGVAPSSSTMLAVAGGQTIKLITKNAYSKQCASEAMIIEAIGADLTAKHFRQATVLKLDLDKMPEDKQESFATAVVKLAQEHGVMNAVSAAQCIQPAPGFHEARTILLTPEQNIALDAAIACTAYPQIG